MKRVFFSLGVGLVFFLLNGSLYGQAFPNLFENQEPLEIKMKFSVKDIREESNDSTYVDSFLQYKNLETGSWDSLDIDLRVRGNFRLQNCYYPPLRVKIKKKKAADTPFDGYKSLKLVLPCQKGKAADGYIMKEYLCYKLFEPITPYTFQTRMVKITFENEDDRKGEPMELTGFLIEDDDDVADRFQGSILDGKKILGTLLEDSAAVRHDFFQLMIGNTDWSSMFQHNMKILQLDEKTVVPLAYDFDMTGMVNPPYSQVSNLVDIEHVTQRLYRGYCRDEALMESIRQEFLEKEDEIWSIIDAHEPIMEKVDVKMVRSYLKDFFDIMAYDQVYRNQIVMACRK